MVKNTQISEKSLLGKPYNRLFSVAVMFSIALIFCLSNISAGLDDPLYAKQFSTITIPMSGSNGTGPWPNCNITSILDPEMIVALRDVAMTQIGSDFAYQFANLSKLGTYTVNTVCYDDAGTVPNSNYIIVTTTGTSGNWTIYAILLIMGFGFLLLLLSIYADNQYMAFISGALFLTSGVLIIIFGFGQIMGLWSDAMGYSVLAMGLWILLSTAFHHNSDQLSIALGIPDKEEVDEYDYFDGEE